MTREEHSRLQPANWLIIKESSGKIYSRKQDSMRKAKVGIALVCCWDKSNVCNITATHLRTAIILEDFMHTLTAYNIIGQ